MQVSWHDQLYNEEQRLKQNYKAFIDLIFSIFKIL